MRHANSPESLVGLAVLATADVVRIEVSDGGRGFTPPPSATLRKHDATADGWGPPIVEAIAQRWGVEYSDGATVWFEVDRSQAGASVSNL